MRFDVKLRPRGSIFAAVLLLAMPAGGPTFAAPHASRPANLNRSLEKPTDAGLFRVKIESAISPIPMNAIHRWKVQISDARGRPVSGATVAVDGGMPEHGHGLPTAPRVAATPNGGQYMIQGMKFSMDGWWEIKLAINAAGRSDKVTFNVVL